MITTNLHFNRFSDQYYLNIIHIKYSLLLTPHNIFQTLVNRVLNRLWFLFVIWAEPWLKWILNLTGKKTSQWKTWKWSREQVKKKIILCADHFRLNGMKWNEKGGGNIEVPCLHTHKKTSMYMPSVWKPYCINIDMVRRKCLLSVLNRIGSLGWWWQWGCDLVLFIVCVAPSHGCRTASGSCEPASQRCVNTTWSSCCYWQWQGAVSNNQLCLSAQVGCIVLSAVCVYKGVKHKATSPTYQQ